MDIIAEVRRRHLVSEESISAIARSLIVDPSLLCVRINQSFPNEITCRTQSFMNLIIGVSNNWGQILTNPHEINNKNNVLI